MPRTATRICVRSVQLAVAHLATLVALLATAPSSAEPARTALVIGNSGYASSPLINPRNDAGDIGKVLEGLGFEVEVAIDRNKEQMTEAIYRFGDRLRERGGVGFFYYAGHGMEVGGENYLIPVGVEIPGERYVKLRGVPVAEVTAGLANARNQLNIVVLDACRNNPFARSWRSSSRGLAVMRAPAETLIAYATEPGDVAADGDGRNSPYASALMDAMQEPGVRLVDMFRRARLQVRESTQGQQTPWQSDNLTAGAFYFVPGAGDAQAVGCPLGTTRRGSQCIADQVACPGASEWDGARCVIRTAAVAPKPGAAPTATQGSSSSSTPDDQGDAYQRGLSAWKRNDHKACEASFLEFLRANPDSPYADEAAYWIADCDFNHGDYKRAVVRFHSVARAYPKGNKAPEALYRQGETLLKLGHNEAAEKAFGRVLDEYPDSQSASDAKKRLRELR